MSKKTRKLFNFYTQSIAVILSIFLIGCQLDSEPEDDGEPIPPAPKTVWDRLSIPTTLPILQSGSGGSVARAQATVNRGSGNQETTDISLDILGGAVSLWTTPEGYLVIQGLEVDFADVSLAADVVPPNGVDLTALQAHVEFPGVALPDSKGDRVTATVPLDLTTEWAIRRNGEIYPMSPVRLENINVVVEVWRNDRDQLEARFVALREGVFWSWADIFELGELMVDLVAVIP